MTWRIIEGDVRDRLRDLDAGSVQTVVTSPPYWGLRDYGSEGQIGFEPTPEEYVSTLVEVFREVRRVLRDDGTVWLNMGDSYASSGQADPTAFERLARNGYERGERWNDRVQAKSKGRAPTSPGLKPKDLVGIPWRLAFALQSDGWYLRSDIIWAKPNPMPESVTDRPTKAHEYLFLLSKSARYFYDAAAVSEQSLHAGREIRYDGDEESVIRGLTDPRFRTRVTSDRTVAPTRNLRDVWTIPTEPFPEAHFATFPKALVEPCVKAGTSEKGCCPECGAAWMRQVETEVQNRRDYGSVDRFVDLNNGRAGELVVHTTGWTPTCSHDADPIPCTVLDPFAGSGTTGVVALRLGRSFVGIELNPEYAEMARCSLETDRSRDGTLSLLNGSSDVPVGPPSPQTELKQDAVGKRTYTGFNERWRNKA